MSLQLLAKQMEAKGRGGDSVLVHMTPGEVEGLQKLAESAGGSLSVNPETGLVEANFLKRMLPTLVGVGVGMFAGPMAGAAAGAAVGGYQAKRNDQDVGMGMLMGGLGGYGGGAMGAGLTAAGAGAGAAAAGAAAPTAAGAAAPLTASQSLAQAGQGITALGADAAKRAAFAKSVGMSGLGMATAPLMAAGKKPGEAPTDDEMYSYTFDPGRTGAERTPSATSAEREYFQSSYSPVRKIRASEYPVYAAQGGLMGLAEGGETAAPTAAEVAAPTASEAALAYLMGERSSSAPARSPLIDAQLMQGRPAPPNPVVGSDNMYAFDPATGTFLRNPNIPGAATSGSRVGTSFSDSGGSYDAPMSPQTDRFLSWEESTPEGKAHRDARMGEIQNLFNLGPTGAFMSALGGKEAKAPNFGTIFSTPEAYESYIADKDSGIFQGTSQSGGSTRGADWESLPADMRGGGDSGGDDGGGRGEGLAGGYDKAAGGLLSLAKGGMKSGGFVVPADVVSMIGEGNTDAGYSRIKSMIPGATAIKGKDGGQADTVKTSIEGKQPARVAHGEMYIPPETVKRMGGAKKLYAMMDRVREQATGSRKQIKPVSLKQAMA
jgi:hypothetical protein